MPLLVLIPALVAGADLLGPAVLAGADKRTENSTSEPRASNDAAEPDAVVKLPASTELRRDTPELETASEGAVAGEEHFYDFEATAYSISGRTASGAMTRRGIIAADPRILPLGSIVHIRAGRYSGTYTVLDTGGLIKGRRIDIYVPAYAEALAFGRRTVKLKVIWASRPRMANRSRR